MMRRLQKRQRDEVKKTSAEPMAEGIVRKAYQRWSEISDMELVSFTKKFIAEEGIGSRNELSKADSGLYAILLKRKLLDEVGLGFVRRERRKWAAMSDEEIVAYAKMSIADMRIENKSQLWKADPGLFVVLRLRKLLNRVFSNIELEKHAEAVQGVLDALESFGE